MTQEDITTLVHNFQKDFEQLKRSIGQVIVGQNDVVEGILICLLAGGHALLEGVPGLGKTQMVRALARSLSLKFSRIQFTPDLMPTDIIGTNILSESGQGAYRVEFRKGPIFTNILLADEINRATPKTQSALLEAMQEHAVTASGTTHQLDEPFMVLATQNPLEMEGTYPLPEAQLDRFLLKIQVPFPSHQELLSILDRTTGSSEQEVSELMSASRIVEIQSLVREVEAAKHVKDYVVRLLEATHPNIPFSSDKVKRFIRYGASPRGAQSILLAAKVRALTDGRFAAACEDVRWALKPALRHRLILNFEGEAEGIQIDHLIDQIAETIPEVEKN